MSCPRTLRPDRGLNPVHLIRSPTILPLDHGAHMIYLIMVYLGSLSSSVFHISQILCSVGVIGVSLRRLVGFLKRYHDKVIRKRDDTIHRGDGTISRNEVPIRKREIDTASSHRYFPSVNHIFTSAHSLFAISWFRLFAVSLCRGFDLKAKSR